jgi:telomerase reverse transcriptase
MTHPQQDGRELSSHRIPGIVAHYPNTNVATVKGPLWRRMHSLLGPGGDRTMMELLLECGIFYHVEGSHGNYNQISGTYS